MTFEEIIQKNFVVISRKGVNIRAKCPFHSPEGFIGGSVSALVFNTEREIWHCFDCGKGGNLEELVKALEEIDISLELERIKKLN